MERPEYGGYERRPKRPRNDRHNDRPQPLVKNKVDKEGRHFSKLDMTARLGYQKGKKAQVVKEPRAAHYRTRPTARRPTDTAMTNHRNLLADKITIKCRAPIEDHAHIVATSRRRYPSRHGDVDKGQLRPKDCTEEMNVPADTEAGKEVGLRTKPRRATGIIDGKPSRNN